MGVYSGALFVDSFPTDLQRLWVCTYLSAPYEQQFKSVSISVKLDEDTLADHPLPQEFIQSFWNQHNAVMSSDEAPRDYEVLLPMHIMISPLVADKPAKLVVKVHVDKQTLVAGSLHIHQQLRNSNDVDVATTE